MRVLPVLVLLTCIYQANAGALENGLRLATGFLPNELRGLGGAAATAATAAAFKKIGAMEFVTDGSDYPYMCVCPTPDQIAQIRKLGATIAPDKCPEDQGMGCQPPQVDMSSAPLPVVKGATPR
jgi:hypothetical protein